MGLYFYTHVKNCVTKDSVSACLLHIIDHITIYLNPKKKRFWIWKNLFPVLQTFLCFVLRTYFSVVCGKVNCSVEKLRHVAKSR